jgi:tetratricopeptide (TPR) repeat protein
MVTPMDHEEKIDEAMQLVEDGDFEGAIKIFLALPPEPQFIEEVGNICFYRMEDPKRALPYFTKAVALMPKDEQANTYCEDRAGSPRAR